MREKCPYSELFWSDLPTFGLNTHSLRIQSECGNIRTRITPNMESFNAVKYFHFRSFSDKTNDLVFFKCRNLVLSYCWTFLGAFSKTLIFLNDCALHIFTMFNKVQTDNHNLREYVTTWGKMWQPMKSRYWVRKMGLKFNKIAFYMYIFIKFVRFWSL